MEQPNINSGDDYAKLIIENILETEKSVPKSQRMPDELLNYLSEEVYTFAKQTWKDYILGKREMFLFTDEEMEELFNKAGERYVGGLLDGMVDKDLLEVSISEEGEFLYGLSEKGKKVANKLFKDKDN